MGEPTKYLIRNIHFSTKVATLVVQGGPVVGQTKQDNSPKQFWILKDPPTHAPNHEHLKTLKNDALDNYAFADKDSVAGNPGSYPWKLISVTAGIHNITNKDESLVWILEKDSEDTPIVLRNYSDNKGNKQAQWEFILE